MLSAAHADDAARTSLLSSSFPVVRSLTDSMYSRNPVVSVVKASFVPSGLTSVAPRLKNFSPFASSFPSSITSSSASRLPFLRQTIGYCFPSTVRE